MPTDTDPPDEAGLVRALLRYRYSQMIAEATSNPYDLALGRKRDGMQRPADESKRHGRFTVIDGGADQ